MPNALTLPMSSIRSAVNRRGADGREKHTAAWTGREMIVWGGVDFALAPQNTGGRYDPIADSWIATPTVSAPSGRQSPTSVWTGREMLIWGGAFDTATSLFNTGGAYDPVANSWKPTSLTGVPTARLYHSAVWTGKAMIVWGGEDSSGTLLNSGGRYDPVADAWISTSSSSPPVPRIVHPALWTGGALIIWGGGSSAGVTNSGARYQ